MRVFAVLGLVAAAILGTSAVPLEEALPTQLNPVPYVERTYLVNVTVDDPCSSDSDFSWSSPQTCERCEDHCPCHRNWTRDIGNRECATNHQCRQDQTCMDGQCVRPCNVNLCGEFAECKVVMHIPSCACKPGYTGDPHEDCSKIIDTRECATNLQCADAKFCSDGVCTDPCSNSPCGANAVCKVSNHFPSCVCKQGFVGDPQSGCQKYQDTRECATNLQCADAKFCSDGVCTDPCSNSPCGANAVCKVSNHFPSCVCKQGFVGDPQSGCQKYQDDRDCASNHQCRQDQTCMDGRCVRPCNANLCGKNADCMVVMHIPRCACKPGHAGNPLEGCSKTKGLNTCQKTVECPLDKSCMAGTCMDPCTYYTCPDNGVCQAKDHRAICLEAIPVKDQGPTSCSANPDCPSDKVCMGKTCVDLCENYECDRGLVCTMKNHKASCAPVPALPSDWPPQNGRQKRFYVDMLIKTDWYSAYMHCLRNDSRLARIENKEENDVVVEMIKKLDTQFHVEYWIGATDFPKVGSYNWMATGQPVEGYTNWHVSQGMTASQRCLTYWQSSKDLVKWNDFHCETKYNFICEYYE